GRRCGDGDFSGGGRRSSGVRRCAVRLLEKKGEGGVFAGAVVAAEVVCYCCFDRKLWRFFDGLPEFIEFTVVMEGRLVGSFPGCWSAGEEKERRGRGGSSVVAVEVGGRRRNRGREEGGWAA
ncbi:hypothetical protein HAX54_014545, partial [Datura stramonium]|nr:hypothetical protein [Datura stramonium]